MIIGSGLLAHAFAPRFAQRDDICIYAAGVSNSGCTAVGEFARERQRLERVLAGLPKETSLVYVGTCSVADPDALNMPYVQHKLAMEALAVMHPAHRIMRLPQVAGRTSNPHTLLNYLYARISRSESFGLWKNARRNIIDVDDVVKIAACLFADTAQFSAPLNIANPVSYSMLDIVHAMERAVGKKAVYEVLDRGSGYAIDIAAILPALGGLALMFGDDYLDRTIEKYYGGAGKGKC